MQLATQQLTNTSQLKKVRRDIRARPYPDEGKGGEMTDQASTAKNQRKLVGRVTSQQDAEDGRWCRWSAVCGRR